MKKYIFCLICPMTKKVKYIGQTRNPLRRYYFYIYSKEKNKVGEWLRSYGKNKPELKVLEFIPKIKIKERLGYWYNYYKKNNLIDLTKNKKSELIRFFVSKKDMELIMKDYKESGLKNLPDYYRSKIL